MTSSTTASLQPTQQFIRYQNPTHGVSIQYPSDWSTDKTKIGDQFISFYFPNSKVQEFSIVEVGLAAYKSSSSSLDHLLKSVINSYLHDKHTFPNFQIIDSNTSSTLAGKPAYKLTATYFDPGTKIPTKVIETGTIVGSKVYYIQVLIDADQYSNYFPTIRKMIDSFTIG
jgi:PsbP